MGGVFYRLFVRPLLYLFTAETAHHWTVGALRLVQKFPLGLWILQKLFAVNRAHPTRALGCAFPNPVGLAAGFDKDARVFPALFALGFGFVEVGTITAQPQPGNPKPRLFRLIRDRALINRMGFNNLGAHAAAAELARLRRPPGAILGVNIGKSKVVPAEEAIADYETSARLLAPYADYLVVNVSSPNTPGLRDLQAVSSLAPILIAVRRVLDETVRERRVPLLVKIAPDLADQDIVSIAQLANDIELDGIIATNTTISRQGLRTSKTDIDRIGAGGLSGAPLKTRSLEVLHLLGEHLSSRVTLVSAGGVETVADAQARLAAGAHLVQVYSALVFQGPALPSNLARGLAELESR